MESAVDALSQAYDELMSAAAGLLEAQRASGGARTAAYDVALTELKLRMDLLMASCDRAEAIVDSARRGISADAAPPACAPGLLDERRPALPCVSTETKEGSEAAVASPAASDASVSDDAAR